MGKNHPNRLILFRGFEITNQWTFFDGEKALSQAAQRLRRPCATAVLPWSMRLQRAPPAQVRSRWVRHLYIVDFPGPEMFDYQRVGTKYTKKIKKIKECVW